MIPKEQLYETVALVLSVAFFDSLERRRPRFPVNHTYMLALNIAALLVVVFAGEFWKVALIRGLNAIDLSGLITAGYISELPGFIKILLGLVLADLSLYWVHRGMHRKRMLWLTHAFHHSIDQLWWLAGSRTSVTHLLLFAAPQVVLGFYVFQLTPIEAGIAFSIGIIVNVWIHTNISVNLGPVEWLLITPNFHRIHHGARGLSGSNLGFVFTVWDRIFGTYKDPRKVGDEFALSAVPTQKRLLRLIVGF